MCVNKTWQKKAAKRLINYQAQNVQIHHPFLSQTKRGLKVNNENIPNLSARINSPASMSRLATRYLIESYKLYCENVNVLFYQNIAMGYWDMQRIIDSKSHYW